MKQQFRLYRRNGGIYYIHDDKTGKQESLHTRERAEAAALFAAKTQSHRQAHLNLRLARTYLAATDPMVSKRTWQAPMEELAKTKRGVTKERWERAIKDKAFDLIRDLPILEMQAEHFLKVLNTGTVSTNVFLRRAHNFALDMGWLPWPVVVKRQWPAIEFKDKRAITWDEHCQIIGREQNPERKAFYRMAWHTGASQSDLAFLAAENVDWEHHVISFERKKTGSIAIMRFAEDVVEILRDLPGSGPLFPYLRTVRAGDRATEFKQRCRGLNIKGVTLHSYRYAWAERAKTAGYPERFAMENLGHNSKAVHRAYARRAQVELPSLSEYERQRKLFANGVGIEPVAQLVTVQGGHHATLERCRLIGPFAGTWAEAMHQTRGPQSLRVMQGLLHLAGKHPAVELEKATRLATHHGAWRLRDLKRLLELPANVVQLDFLETHPLIRSLDAYRIEPAENPNPNQNS